MPELAGPRELYGAEVATAAGLSEVEEAAQTVDVAVVDMQLGAEKRCDVVAAMR